MGGFRRRNADSTRSRTYGFNNTRAIYVRIIPNSPRNTPSKPLRSLFLVAQKPNIIAANPNGTAKIKRDIMLKKALSTQVFPFFAREFVVPDLSGSEDGVDGPTRLRPQNGQLTQCSSRTRPHCGQILLMTFSPVDMLPSFLLSSGS